MAIGMAPAAIAGLDITKEALLYMIKHVVLPPKLPGSSDNQDFMSTDRLLLDYLLAALPDSSSEDFVSVDQNGSLRTTLKQLIQTLIRVTDDNGRLNAKPLSEAFAQLPTEGGIIPIFIQAQNAALIVRKDGDSIIFEAFELAPSHHATMSTKGRLRRCFPGPAIGVRLHVFNEPGFQTTVVETLVKLSSQDATEMKSTARKAAQIHIEDRDTVRPDLVTELLMSFLDSVGEPLQTLRVWKNTREEVAWSNARLPWTRSPVWLLARVALQTTLYRLTGSESLYKQVMIVFMTELTTSAQAIGVSCDILHCLVSKVSRRLSKLQSTTSLTRLQKIEATLNYVTQGVQATWDTVANSEPKLPTQDLMTLDFQKDSILRLEELDDYILFVRESASREYLVHTFLPPNLMTQFASGTLPSISTSKAEGSIYVLAAFEAWIFSDLSSWLTKSLSEPGTCGQLYRLLSNYHTAASAQYQANPERLSLMLLTCLELWVACDKSATQQHPLLLDYNPRVPSELLQSLILPLKSQLERLAGVDDYLAEREAQAKGEYPSPFLTFRAKNSFAVRYYATSPAHQELRAEIEEWAQKKRERKKQELSEKKAEYARLMALYNTLECEYGDVYDRRWGFMREDVHLSSCKKCARRDEAKRMSIDLDEWPLPRAEMDAQTTVFELDCPTSFNDWRDATLFLKMDVLRSQYTKSRKSDHDYGPRYSLSSFIRTTQQTLRLLSTTKPHIVTHRRSILVTDATNASVCVNNGLTYEYFDVRRGCFAADVSTTEEIPNMCTYQLQHHKSLQEFIYRPSSQPHGPFPNRVIAQQHSCPSGMSLEEFKSLATLPLGVRLQWSNILVQLSLPSIDLKKMDTTLVLLQIIHQSGPRSGRGIARDGHLDLNDERFGRELGSALVAGLERIKENWESRHALESFIAIAARLLSLCGSEDVKESCRVCLRLCRRVAMGWARKLRTMAWETVVQAEKDELLHRAFENALVCTSTFDVDECHLRFELTLPAEATIFVESSIMVHETTHAALDQNDLVQQISIQRWCHLSSRALSTLLSELCTGRNPYLDLAVGKRWSGYRLGCGWQSHSELTRHWVTSTTASKSDAASQAVQYNILTGELRVDGLPLSRLPGTFEGHAMYKVLFDQSTIEVMRTAIAGKEFAAMNRFRGYEVYFALQSFDGGRNPALAGQDLMLTCKKGEVDQLRYDLLPPRIFKDKLPDHFVEEYVQWYNYREHTVEFRPKSDPWKSSAEQWKLSKADQEWIMTQGNDSFLANMTSPTGKDISKLLASIESARHMHLIFHPSQGQLDIELPRLNLNFYLRQNTSQVLSRQFRGMYLDSNQRIGTLVGLTSKAILRDGKDGRVVLIPNGTVAWKATEQHVAVEIQHGTSTKVYPFELDTLLGRITDNGTLESKLALCYFHALTSFCLPDELTGKTGTEQALEILNSASVRSFDNFSEENISALHDIASLTPRRNYYPQNLQVMQDVRWDRELSPLSQHGRFYKDVSRLLLVTEKLAFFYPGATKKRPDLSRGDWLLHERDLIRSSTFRTYGFGAEDLTEKYDKIYDSSPRLSMVKDTDCANTSTAESWKGKTLFRSAGIGDPSSRYVAAFRTASKVYHGHQDRQSEVPQSLCDHLWVLLREGLADVGKEARGASGRMNGNRGSLPGSTIAFDAERLHDWKKFLGLRWCEIHRALSEVAHNKFKIMMFLGTIAYAYDIDPQVIEVLTAMSNVPAFRVNQITVPVAVEFDLQKGRKLNAHELRAHLEAQAKPFADCPEYNSPSLPSESRNDTWNRRTRDYESKKTNIVARIVKDFMERQWPCQILQKPNIPDVDTYVKIDAVLSAIKGSVQSHWDCHRFYEYLRCIEQASKRQNIRPLPGSTLSVVFSSPGATRGRSWLTDSDLFSSQAPPLTSQGPQLPQLTRPIDDDAAVTERLMSMISRLGDHATLRHKKEYIEDLNQSSKGLQTKSSRSTITASDRAVDALLRQNVKNCEEHLDSIYTSLIAGLNYTSHITLGGTAAKYNSPRVSPVFFLKQLAQKRWARLPESWKDAVVAYGIAITTLQRAHRLWILRHSEPDLIKELLNTGHENWSPHDDPETLLIEVESGILVRNVQAEIAEQMKHPAGNENAVMQLNMGEGKSSVIVPIVAAAEADGSRLVRVVVAKPQSKQMFQMLVSKLGGLCDRQVYHMPFSRSLVLGLSEVDIIAETFRTCIATGGILLVQPEHLLSFQLMGIETNLARDVAKQKVSESLLRTQHFFNYNSRDIVDESDENFSVKFELVYTMGTQRPIDFSPGRWYLVQTLLRAIRKVIPEIQQQLPGSVELEHGPPGSFPRTRLLRQDAQDLLCQRLASDIREFGLPDFPVARQPEAVRDAVFKYITEPELTAEEISAVEDRTSFWTDAVKQPLLLLRGLIAGGVFAFAFGQKRWRVNYGLTPTRRPETRLAVPYRAKDSPALRSEFSHPDVVILLTCLSYYYGGLEDKDLFTAFEHIIKSDQADNEYEEWVRDAPSLPASFRSLVGINLKDRYQCTRDIFPHFRQAQAVIDFFLARVVFPKHMKEFPDKLSASGWDLGQVKRNPTTGFSGTNDSKHLLPLTVRHLDLDEQRHTNALVLLHLLQSENKVEMMGPLSDSKCSDAARLLQLVIGLEHEAQVILDVGAQVIELSNIEVAAKWLEMTASTPKKQAVVFFDERDNILVRDRAGHVEAFQTSPYAKQLDLCYVFLDEAHTRGTDLKLPEDYRAVVTLGAGLTKDRLVQACMRMRKLGKGQSVVFCIPEEIRMKIMSVTGKTEDSSIDVSDVLIWSIHETYSDLRRSMPLWAAQGLRYESQSLIWAKSTSTSGITMSTQHAEEFLEKEALDLEERYKPRSENDAAEALLKGSGDLPRAEEIRNRCQRFDSMKFTAAALQEEQERELSPEIEAERQIEKPRAAEAEPHHLHKHVIEFIETGTIVSVHPAFMPAFKALSTISAADYYDVGQFPTDLLVTADFARTVKLVGKKVQSDSFQRSVQWVVTTRAAETPRMVIISPYEAEYLKFCIKKSYAVFLHLYAPRSNLAFHPLDELKLYTVPELPDGWRAPAKLVLQLNLFAGQLYFRSYEEYKSACELLGLAWHLMDGSKEIEPDGFIVPGTWDTNYKFRKSPTKFLQVLMATIRRDGRSIGKTHWGRVLAGEILSPDEFEDPARMDESM